MNLSTGEKKCLSYFTLSFFIHASSVFVHIFTDRMLKKKKKCVSCLSFTDLDCNGEGVFHMLSLYHLTN